MKMEHTERSETSAYEIQTLGNYPEEGIQHSEHGESLKSRTFITAIKATTPAVKTNIFNFIFIHLFIYESSKRVRISSRATRALFQL